MDDNANCKKSKMAMDDNYQEEACEVLLENFYDNVFPRNPRYDDVHSAVGSDHELGVLWPENPKHMFYQYISQMEEYFRIKIIYYSDTMSVRIIAN
jgi:hypothetical protein